MMSPVNVVLLALGILGLVGRALATTPSSYTCFKPDPLDKITIDDLLTLLGRSFTTDNYLVESTRGHRIYWRLEDTMDKNKAGAILDQYSVQELVDLNTWSVAECSNEGLDKRRQTCGKFCTHEQSTYVNPPESQLKVNRQEAWTKHNLGIYCWEVFEDMLDKCADRELEDQMSRKELNRIWRAFTFTRRIPIFTQKLSNYLKRKGPVKSAELWNHCSKVVKVFDAPRSYTLWVNTDWYQFVLFCREFTNDFTLDGHAKNDLKKVETD